MEEEQNNFITPIQMEKLLKQHNYILKLAEGKSFRKLSNTEKVNKIWLLLGGFNIITINDIKYYSYNFDWKQ